LAFLILNAGSSTLKFSLLDPGQDRTWAHGSTDSSNPPVRYTWSAGADDAVSDTLPDAGFGAAVGRIVGDVAQLVQSLPAAAIEAVVHRIVHGGSRFIDPVPITQEIRTALADLIELAPLHNRPGVDVIDTALEALPHVPHVAVFDTAFHATLPPEAFTYPLPYALNERWGLRRFGFHGLSHAYCAGRAAEMISPPADGLHLVIAHLGSGASVTATRGGRSIDTSMGFTPLEGLMMGTRSGSIDPGLLLHLQLRCGVSAEALYRLLYQESGLLGVSGTSSDMREIIDASDAGDARAALAVRIFAHRARQAIGAAAVTLGRVDALVFTGGIGEHSHVIRGLVCEGLSCLGLEIDPAANAPARTDADISSSTSRGRILVLTTREDLMMARAAHAILKPAARP
jgi:acetate kinase